MRKPNKKQRNNLILESMRDFMNFLGIFKEKIAKGNCTRSLVDGRHPPNCDCNNQ